MTVEKHPVSEICSAGVPGDQGPASSIKADLNTLPDNVWETRKYGRAQRLVATYKDIS